jgi:hypothetical protein
MNNIILILIKKVFEINLFAFDADESLRKFEAELSKDD